MSDFNGKLAALGPNSTNEVQLYSVPVGYYVIGVVRVVNHTSENQSFCMAHCTTDHGDIPANFEDFIAWNEVVLPNKSIVLSVKLNSEETLRVKEVTSGTLSFLLSGTKRAIL